MFSLIKTAFIYIVIILLLSFMVLTTLRYFKISPCLPNSNVSKYIGKILHYIGLYIFDNSDLVNTFKEGMSFFKKVDILDIYQLPFSIILSHKETNIFSNTSLHNKKNQISHTSNAFQWQIFDTGVLIETHHSLIMQDTSQWNELIGLINYYRSDYAINHIILTISAIDITENENELRNIAARYHDKIIHMQNQFNLNIPIYILISDLDKIPGFDDFTQSIPEKFLQDILGYSLQSSNALNIDKTENIASSAINTIGNRIEYIEHISYCNLTEFNDGIALFKHHLYKLELGLQSFLTLLFKKNIHFDTFLLRGIYMTGQFKTQSAFLNNLLIEKIFSEAGLARSIKQFAMSNAYIIFQRVFIIFICLISFISLYSEITNLQQKTITIQGICSELEIILRKSLIFKQSNNSNLKQYIKNIEDNISKLNKNTLTSTLFPISWNNDIDLQISNMLAHVIKLSIIQRVIIQFYRHVTLTKSGQLISKIASTKFSSSPLSSIEFLSLNEYVKQVAYLTKISQELQHLSKTGSLSIFNEVINRLFDEDIIINKNFAYIYKIALLDMNAYHLSIDKFQKTITIHTSNFIEKFIFMLKNHTSTSPHIDTVNHNLELFSSISNQYSAEDLLSLHESVGKIINIFKSNASNWLELSTFEHNQNYTKFIETMNKSNYDTEDISKWQNKINLALHQLKQKMTLQKMPIIDNFLKVNNDIITISDSLNNLHHILQKVVQEKFIQPVEADTLTSTILNNEYLIWDPNILTDLTDLIDSFESFLQKQLMYMPPNIRVPLKTVCYKNMYKQVEKMLADSQKISRINVSSENDLMMRRIQNLISTKQSLITILNFVEKFEDKGLFNRLKKLLYDQNHQLLNSINNMFVKENLYMPNTKPIQPKKVEDFIISQRNKLKEMSIDYASNVLELLHYLCKLDKKTSSELMKIWEFIVQEVSSKELNTNINDLEETIKQFINKFDINDLKDVKHELEHTQGDNYFIQKKRDFLTSRKKYLFAQAEQKAKMLYTKLREFFESKLATRFPFASTSAKNIPIQDLRDLQKFWQSKMTELPKIIDTLKDDDQYKNNAAFTFMSNMATTIPWIEFIIDPIKYKTSISVNLRNLLHLEKFGGHIVQWKVRFNEQTYSAHSTQMFTIAANSSIIDYYFRISKESSFSFLVNNKATKEFGFSYSDPLSILRWISKHAVHIPGYTKPGIWYLQYALPVVQLSVDKKPFYIILWDEIEVSGHAREFPIFPTSMPPHTLQGNTK